MLRTSIRNKIVSIAIGLIILMVITSALSIVMAGTVGHLLNELTNKYVPAYGNLARADTRSVERGLALRQIVIAKMQNPPDDAVYAQRLKSFEDTDQKIYEEAEAARKLIMRRGLWPIAPPAGTRRGARSRRRSMRCRATDPPRRS